MKKSQLKEFIKSSLMNEENSSSDLFNKLESLLKTHDWFYMMSDDNRKYSNGSAQQQDIRAIVKTLTGMGEGEKAKELYNKYAPYTPGGSDLRMKEASKMEKTLDEAMVSPDNRIEYLAQTLAYVWDMGKSNNTIDFKSLAQSTVKDMFDEESLGEAEDTQLEKTAKDAAIKAEQAKIKAAQEKITNLNKGLQNENEDEEEGVDTSMDKVAKALSAVQKKLDQMFADFKMGKMSKDEYMSKRKDLQAKRDKLNAALISFEEDEDEI